MLLCGRVDDHHAAPRRRIDVDVVETDAGAADDDAGRGPAASTSSVTVRGRADDQRAGRPPGRREQLVRRQVEAHVDLVAGRPQAVEPALGDLFGDEDPRHTAHAYRLARIAQYPPLASPASGPSRGEPDADRRTARSSSGSSGGASRTSSSATTRRPQIWARAAAAARRRLPAPRPQRPRPEALECGREPRRRRLRRRRLVVTWFVANRLRGRRWLERPPAIGWPELAVFIVVPALPSIVVGQWGDAAADVARGGRPARRPVGRSPATASFPLLRWAGQRTLAQLAVLFNVVVRALPLLLLFTTFLFINAEVWQVAGTLSGIVYVARARRVLPARRGVRAVAGAVADAPR